MLMYQAIGNYYLSKIWQLELSMIKYQYLIINFINQKQAVYILGN